MTTETVTCPRCDGNGHIEAFGHYADGICFLCYGRKTIEVDREKQIRELGPEIRTKAEWVLASTPESYEGLSYSKLEKIRTFSHGGWGIGEAYPTLLSHYREVGEPAFQRASERMRDEYYANQ